MDVGGREISRIGRGLLVLLGVSAADGVRQADWIASKLLGLRMFEGPAGQFDASVADAQGAVLLVSQFTLYADTRKGRRPSFAEAAAAPHAALLYERVQSRIAESGVPVGAGCFGAHMQVRSINDGPVTLIVEAPEQVA